MHHYGAPLPLQNHLRIQIVSHIFTINATFVKFLMLFKGSLLPPLTDLLSRIEGSGPQENASFLNHFDYIKVRQMALFTAVLFWVV
jgi:hypothetical protein